jgi:hypothetical protein
MARKTHAVLDGNIKRDAEKYALKHAMRLIKIGYERNQVNQEPTRTQEVLKKFKEELKPAQDRKSIFHLTGFVRTLDEDGAGTLRETEFIHVNVLSTLIS